MTKDIDSRWPRYAFAGSLEFAARLGVGHGLNRALPSQAEVRLDQPDPTSTNL
jgi:hypothetical protein